MKSMLSALLLLFPLFLNAQVLIQYEFARTISRVDLNIAAQIFGINYEADNDVDVFRVLYYSPDLNGDPDTLSGMVAIPAGTSEDMPMVLFQHGTTDGKFDVPSSGEFFNILLEVGFAGKGFIVSSADYLGMGISRGFHPYVHARTEAIAGIDMLFAAREVCDAEQVAWNDFLFISGYSQGGHAAMAAHMEIQLQGIDLDVTGSAPMSGPYSVSTEMKSRILSEEIYTYPAYLPYLLHGYQTVYGNLYQDLSEFYREPYASIIRDGLLRPDYSINFLNDTLNKALQLNEGAMKPKLMFQDSILEGVANDPGHRINVALRDNDVYDWVPDVPMRMYYCEADEQVVFTNATFTDSLMNARGAKDVAAESVGSQYMHRECAPHALVAAIDFFRSLMVTPSQKDRILANAIDVFPNPAQGRITVTSNLDRTGDVLMIQDLSGRIIKPFSLEQNNTEVDISDLPAGGYILRGASSQGVLLRRFIKI